MIINNHLTGSKYKESGKVDIPRFFLFLIVGYVISSLVGIGYGLLSELNPFIYLNFILLIVAIAGVALSVFIFKSAGRLRNRFVVIILALFFGIVCIYNAWVAVYTGSGESVFEGMIFNRSFSVLVQLVSLRSLNIGHIGTDGAGLGPQITSIIYIIELLILVIVPAIYIGKNPSYYCEECHQSMNETADEFYYGFNPEQSPNIESDVKSGKLKEMLELVTYPEKKLNRSLRYIRCTLHECPECKKMVYSADLGDAKLEKDKTSFKKEASLAVNLYGSRTN